MDTITNASEQKTTCGGIRKIDRENKKVLVTKEFLIRSSQYGTAEFEKYPELQAEYPGFSIEVFKAARNANKQSYANLTFERMEEFMEGFEPDEDSLRAVKAEYEELRQFLKGQKGIYLQVKSWFLDKYKDEFKRIRDEKAAAKRAEENASLIYIPAVAEK